MTWTPLGTSVTGKVGPKGQIVIPKAFRDRVGMRPGATVFIDQSEDGTITVEFAWNSILEAPDYFAKFPVVPGMEGKTSLDILHEMDAEDEAVLERKYGPWSPPASPSTPSPSSPSSSASRAGSALGRTSTPAKRGPSSSG